MQDFSLLWGLSKNPWKSDYQGSFINGLWYILLLIYFFSIKSIKIWLLIEFFLDSLARNSKISLTRDKILLKLNWELEKIDLLAKSDLETSLLTFSDEWFQSLSQKSQLIIKKSHMSSSHRVFESAFYLFSFEELLPYQSKDSGELSIFCE